MALQLKWDARPHRPHRPPARRTDTFSKSDNNTLRQILAEGKNCINLCKLMLDWIRSDLTVKKVIQLWKKGV